MKSKGAKTMDDSNKWFAIMVIGIAMSIASTYIFVPPPDCPECPHCHPTEVNADE